MAQATEQLGFIHQQREQLSQARAYYKKAQQIHQMIGDSNGQEQILQRFIAVNTRLN